MAEERTQRRLAAILAADVVGYSRLMEADEAGTLARLNALRSELFDPAISRFGGRIFKNSVRGRLPKARCSTRLRLPNVFECFVSGREESTLELKRHVATSAVTILRHRLASPAIRSLCGQEVVHE